MEFDYEPVRLPSKPHYEDVTQDEGLKFLVPKLRKQIVQKEAEEKYQIEQARLAKKQRDEFEK